MRQTVHELCTNPEGAVRVEFGAPKAGGLPKGDTGGVSDMYSTRLGYRSLRKRVSISPVNLQTRV